MIQLNSLASTKAGPVYPTTKHPSTETAFVNTTLAQGSDAVDGTAVPVPDSLQTPLVKQLRNWIGLPELRVRSLQLLQLQL